MRFSIEWTETALDQLAQVWLRHDDPNAVTAEAAAIDHHLSVDAHLKGDDYFGDRSLLLNILWILYRVDQDNTVVRVLQIGENGIDLPHENVP